MRLTEDGPVPNGYALLSPGEDGYAAWTASYGPVAGRPDGALDDCEEGLAVR